MFKYFFYNASTNSYMDSVILASPTLMSELDIYVLDHEFMHVVEGPTTLTEIADNALLSAPLTGVNIIDIDTHVILEVDDLDLDLTGIDKDDISTYVVANKERPLFMIRSDEVVIIQDENTYNADHVTLNFSPGFSKMMSIRKSDLHPAFEQILMTTDIEALQEIIPRPQPIPRTEFALSAAEDHDKKRITGKYSAYTDISISGRPHPLTGDLAYVAGNAAIAQSLRNIILANTYDRPFSSKNIAGNVNALLFEFNDSIMHDELKTTIALAITNHEPRVNLLGVNVIPSVEAYTIKVDIVYAIKTTNTSQTLSIILDRA